jgi:virulence-associated protein VapD
MLITRPDPFYNEVKKTLEELGCEELSGEVYQKMMNEMYAKTLKPVSKYQEYMSEF